MLTVIYAYVANGNGLNIVDISNPNAPTTVGNYNTSGNAYDVNIVGSYAYVADGNKGVQIIDISNHTSPTLVVMYDTSGFAYKLKVLGNYAYVADGAGGLAIIKVKMTDTDNDGTPDVADTDDDNDGISDADELANGLNPLDASDATQDADGDGISNIDEINAGTDPQVANLTQIEQFVKRFYQVILGRSPDAAGLAYWSSSLESLGKSGADIAKGFIFSAEYAIDSKSNDAYLATLYSAFFNRPADAAGKTYWLEQMAQGMTREEVLDGFLNSIEFKNLADSYGIIPNATPVELFVSRFYKQTLGRLPDAAGLASWTSKLNSGTASGSDVAFGFVFSEEFTARGLDNTDFLNVLYRAFFAREPDIAGFNGWKTQLDAGTSREEVLQGFLGAPEFANLAGGYGIRVR